MVSQPAPERLQARRRARFPLPAWLAVLVSALLLSPASHAQDDRRSERERMVANIAQLAAAGAGGATRRLDPSVMAAMRRVPRHEFVPEPEKRRAYADHPLAIGYEQTISQPFMVALMTDLLKVERNDVVLEVGTGSGYQAAVLSGLVRHVYTIEIVPELAARAEKDLKRLGYDNVTVRAGDGYAGWPEHAPFDAIMVTAGARRIPQALVRQLKPGGRLVIPVGPDARNQELVLITKTSKGQVRTRKLMKVIFVPLVDPSGAPR
jgi:protein-L-isoaspartate(D-aspartate) O-methyltransferase